MKVDRSYWTLADWRAEAGEMKHQRDLTEDAIQNLKSWRRAICNQLGIKVKSKVTGALQAIKNLQERHDDSN